MKQVIFWVLFTILIRTCLFAQTIPASEARRNMGTTTTVKGKVFNFELTNNAKTTILYITRDFPYHDLSVIIDDNRADLKQHPELFINGKTISVKGAIFNWRGQPCIKVAKWADVTIIDTPGMYPAYMANTPEYKPLEIFRGDTLAYIFANFVFNKVEYENQPLNSILKKSELPVCWYLPITEGFGSHDGPRNTGMYLYFYTRRMTDRKVKEEIDPGILVIIFKQSMPDDSAYILLRKYYMKHNDSLGFYNRKRIVDSIDYVHYHFRKEAPKDTSLWPHYPVIKRKFKKGEEITIDGPVD